jgi:hypothetical protein
VRILKAADKPLANLSEALAGICTKIWSLVLKIENFIFKDSKSVGTFCNGEIDANWLELAQLSLLLCAPEAFNTQTTLEFLERISSFAPLICLGKGDSFSLCGEMDLMAKNNKLTKIKCTDWANNSINQCFTAHRERRMQYFKRLNVFFNSFQLQDISYTSLRVFAYHNRTVYAV